MLKFTRTDLDIKPRKLADKFLNHEARIILTNKGADFFMIHLPQAVDVQILLL